jgi:hypothetical protein
MILLTRLQNVDGKFGLFGESGKMLCFHAKRCVLIDWLSIAIF